MWEYVDDDIHYQEDFNYFYYEGSMTYPGCQEPVQWFIIQ